MSEWTRADQDNKMLHATEDPLYATIEVDDFQGIPGKHIGGTISISFDGEQWIDDYSNLWEIGDNNDKIPLSKDNRDYVIAVMLEKWCEANTEQDRDGE